VTTVNRVAISRRSHRSACGGRDLQLTLDCNCAAFGACDAGLGHGGIQATPVRTTGAIAAKPPTSITRPSMKTAPPAPSPAAQAAVMSAPSGSGPTNAAAQIAIVRARSSSQAMAGTTTFERPTKTTPQKPPSTASASEGGIELETPTAAIASALKRQPARARPCSARRASPTMRSSRAASRGRGRRSALPVSGARIEPEAGDAEQL